MTLGLYCENNLLHSQTQNILRKELARAERLSKNIGVVTTVSHPSEGVLVAVKENA